MNSVSIKTIAIPGPTLNKERSLRISNNTDNYPGNPVKPPTRKILLELDADLDQEVFNIFKSANVSLTYMDDEEEGTTQEEKDLLFLTVEVSGYDPIGKEIRVLKTLKTAVLED